MGRTPVREAIKRLALENLVTVFPRRGTFASEINITDLAHISDVRQQLEGHAAYRAAAAAHRSPPRRARGAARPHRRAAGGATRDELMELDAEIHRFVHRASGEPVPRGDARALLQPLAADLVPRPRPAAAPDRAGARAPGAARGDPRRRGRPRARHRRRARRHVRDRDPQRALGRTAARAEPAIGKMCAPMSDAESATEPAARPPPAWAAQRQDRVGAQPRRARPRLPQHRDRRRRRPALRDDRRAACGRTRRATPTSPFWTTELAIRLGDSGIAMDLREWVNQGLMTLFFLVVGLEAKRELDLGQLRERSRHRDPGRGRARRHGAAGRDLPRLQRGRPGRERLGRGDVDRHRVRPRGPRARRARTGRAPASRCSRSRSSTTSSRSSSSPSPTPSTSSSARWLIGGRRCSRSSPSRCASRRPRLLAGAARCSPRRSGSRCYTSGIDPIIAGLAVGLLVSAYQPVREDLERVVERVRSFREQPTPELARSAQRGVASAISPNERLQYGLHPWTSFVIVPLFALANTGVRIDGDLLSRRAHLADHARDLLRLRRRQADRHHDRDVAGDPAARRARPSVSWPVTFLGGVVGGIGFTVSLLISSIAFNGRPARRGEARRPRRGGRRRPCSRGPSSAHPARCRRASAPASSRDGRRPRRPLRRRRPRARPRPRRRTTRRSRSSSTATTSARTAARPRSSSASCSTPSATSCATSGATCRSTTCIRAPSAPPRRPRRPPPRAGSGTCTTACSPTRTSSRPRDLREPRAGARPRRRALRRGPAHARARRARRRRRPQRRRERRRPARRRSSSTASATRAPTTSPTLTEAVRAARSRAAAVALARRRGRERAPQAQGVLERAAVAEALGDGVRLLDRDAAEEREASAPAAGSSGRRPSSAATTAPPASKTGAATTDSPGSSSSTSVA